LLDGGMVGLFFNTEHKTRNPKLKNLSYTETRIHREFTNYPINQSTNILIRRINQKGLKRFFILCQVKVWALGSYFFIFNLICVNECAGKEYKNLFSSISISLVTGIYFCRLS
jgi:hypothetical protein